MSIDWRVQICCRACGKAIEAPLGALERARAAICPDSRCGAVADFPPDLADTARFMFEESCRRLAANDRGPDPRLAPA